MSVFVYELHVVHVFFFLINYKVYWREERMLEAVTTLKSLTGEVINIDHVATTEGFAGKPWVLAFPWLLLWHIPLI